MRIFEGRPAAGDRRFALVASRFNGAVTRRLVEGCLRALKRRRVRADRIDLVWVPGAFEIPLAARRLAGSGRYGAVVCLGAVIRGETHHFDLVAREAAAGIAAVARETGVPCVFEVLATDTEEQALARADKGASAADVALRMADLLARLDAVEGD